MIRKTPREELIGRCLFANNEEELRNLASIIRTTFPMGMQPYTKTPNRQPVRELADALLRFEDYFDMQATKEEIIDATNKYVREHFTDPYRVASKYFIIKDLTREGRGIISPLAAYIENARDVDNTDITSNWIEDSLD